MKSWSIGEVARLLGVKTHVIRYWESELPLLSPKKGLSGRREYSGNEVRLLMKFRHLLYERKFTIEGAKRRLWEELGAGEPDVAARFAMIRTDLIDALMTVRATRGPIDGEGMSDRDVQHEADGAPQNTVDAAGAGGPSAGADTESALREQLEAAGQGHLFAHWTDRDPAQRRRLLDDLASLDLGLVEELLQCLAVLGPDGGAAPGSGGGPRVFPAPYVSLAESRRDREALERGEELIRRGAAALLTVAGGQGSRLGYDGPKGMFPITPIRKLTLFALFAEKILAARRWYGAQIPWLIMTGPHNHDATVSYFAANDWFGLGRDTVRLFVQGSVPAFSPDGKLLVAPNGGLFTNPNGHGGVVDALRHSGALAAMKERGVAHLFHFQVDNPLVRVPDPLFLGFHARAGAQVSSKVIEKAYPGEKLGVIATAGGVPRVIEYSDLPADLMEARASDGQLLFRQGSIAVHLLDVDFLTGPSLRLPWHLARKKARVLIPARGGAEIVERDAVKMERFVFDTIPAATTALFFETERAEEFAPLKNKDGVDSIATCVQGQVEQAASWLAAAGVEVPRDDAGRSRHLVEISPLFAMDPAVLAARRGLLKDRIDEDTLLA
jgi:UDP-N-acetylglucosamine/UDP-N-acetylgalactosamine diphosphorylase